jgi:hypothetical protein
MKKRVVLRYEAVHEGVGRVMGSCHLYRTGSIPTTRAILGDPRWVMPAHSRCTGLSFRQARYDWQWTSGALFSTSASGSSSRLPLTRLAELFCRIFHGIPRSISGSSGFVPERSSSTSGGTGSGSGGKVRKAPDTLTGINSFCDYRLLIIPSSLRTC